MIQLKPVHLDGLDIITEKSYELRNKGKEFSPYTSAVVESQLQFAGNFSLKISQKAS